MRLWEKDWVLAVKGQNLCLPILSSVINIGCSDVQEKKSEILHESMIAETTSLFF